VRRWPRRRFLFARPVAMVAAIYLASISLVAISSSWLARAPDVLPGAAERFHPPVPHDPNAIELGERLERPSRAHLLGTDDLGRDLASRMIHGAAVSLTIAAAATFSAVFLGTLLGSLAGYWGGAADWVISRLIETISCFPFLFLLLAIVSVATPSVGTTVLALTITGWTTEARLVRAEFLRLRKIEFAEAARASGARHWRIAFRHLLPHALTPVLVSASFAMGSAILLESAISFLGFGVSMPTPSWGGILADAQANLSTAWWMALFPGVAIALTVLACNILGETLRDALDPREVR
jgi:peptide/nickel transport system permease protein